MNYLICDVETFGTDPKNGKLLGIAFCNIKLLEPEYVCLQWYDHKSSTWVKSKEYDLNIEYLKLFLTRNDLIGHNYTYDKSWIDFHLGIESRWHADTRLMWHMASAPSGPRGYGLKEAQVELLGYKEKGNTSINEQIKARGGKPGEGIYLADKELIAQYAMIDAKSTAELYNHLKPFFDKHEYWWMLEEMMQYSWLLQWCTESGILVDTLKLNNVIERLEHTKNAYTARFMELMHTQVDKLERMWKEDRAAKYTIEGARQRFLSNWDMQKKFKLSSDKDKRELFYDILKLPVVVTTEGGKPSTGVDAIKLSIQQSKREDLAEVMECYEEAESSGTLIDSFAKPWSNSLINSHLHPRFNPCGTVSYRLSGFKPYMLNAPFDEQELMSVMTCDEGWEGVHADFSSIEPCVTAHYSQDPNLLKVFKEGKGDVYLDLALTLFPLDQELRMGYDPRLPITSEVKERFKKQRKVAKIIQLAVQYTGTKYTVQKNLSQNGLPTTLNEAGALVDAYHKHFRKVKVMDETLFMRFDKQGYLRNAVGRIIRVPITINIKRKDGTIWEKPIGRYKDLPNRFIQSSAHDLLSFWVLSIARKVKEQGLKAKPILIDCHDSTSWQAPKEEIPRLEAIFKESLTELNNQVKMTVEIKAEMKRFTTLAGLKGDE